MGQKQIVLIVLGVIIVGIAIAIGNSYFQSNSVQFNRDAVIKDLNNLATDARIYYKKEKTHGGGGKSFLGYTIPNLLSENDNGRYSTVSVSPQLVIFRGIGVENGEQGFGCTTGDVKITYRISVFPDSTSLRKVY